MVVPPGRYWVAAATMTPVTMMMAPVISKAGKGRVVTGRIRPHAAGVIITAGTTTAGVVMTGATMVGTTMAGIVVITITRPRNRISKGAAIAAPSSWCAGHGAQRRDRRYLVTVVVTG